MTSKSFAQPLSALDARFEAQKIAFGPVVFQCVRIALKWGLLQSLRAVKAGCTVAQLAQTHGRSEYAISVLMETCLSAAVVSLVDDHYRLETIGHFFLADELTRVNLEFNHEICYLGMFELETALIEARPAGLKSLGEWPDIYRGLRDLSEAGKKAWFDFDHLYSDSAFSHVLPSVFSSHPSRLMDVGANTGKFAAKCLDFDAKVELVLVDLPQQLRVAEQNLAAQTRVHYSPVDMLDDGAAFPVGNDVVWMSQFLSCFDAATIASIFRRARAGVKADGWVYVLDTFWDRQRFDIAAYCVINTSPYFTALANGVSKMYRSEEYIELAREAGLRLVDIRDEIGLGHSLLKFAAA